MNCLRRIAAALVLAAAIMPQTASAEEKDRWFVCTVAPSREVRYATPPTLVTPDQDRFLTTRFRSYVRSAGIDEDEAHIDCNVRSIGENGPELREWEIPGNRVNVGSQSNPVMMRIVAFPNLPKDWINADAPNAPKPVASSRKAVLPSITIIEGPKAKTSQEIEAEAFAMQQEIAISKIKQAAADAKAKAETERLIAQALEKLKKLGRRQ